MLTKLLYKLALIGLGVVSVCLLKFISHLLSVRRALRHVPGPRASSWIWGEEWNLYHNRPGIFYKDWHEKYGKLVRFTGTFGHQIISITDPRAISFILQDEIYKFPKPKGVREWFRATLGEGILWVEGKEDHERQRRILAPALSAQAVRNLTYIFHETATKMAAHWGKIIDESHTGSAEIEVTNWAGRYALDTVARAAFSYDFGCLDDALHPLATTLDGLTNNENKASSFYMRALFWIFPSILAIGEKGEMIRRTKKELGDIATKMWKDAKNTGDSSGNEKTILAKMLKADRESPEPIDEEHIVSQMRTTISAGYETVTAIISWVLYELAFNPDLQTKIREEASVAGPSLDEINSKYYPLLDAVVNETLRCHPAILENHHEAAETISIPLSAPIPGTTDTQLIIPKGTLISIPVNVIQTNKEIWGEDAHVFRPERWLEAKEADSTIERIPRNTPDKTSNREMGIFEARNDSAAAVLAILEEAFGEASSKQDTAARSKRTDAEQNLPLPVPMPVAGRSLSGRHGILAFSQGPRSCIGKSFAIAEIKVLTIILIRQFSFTCPYEIEPFQSFVIRPRVKGQGASSLPLAVKRI